MSKIFYRTVWNNRNTYVVQKKYKSKKISMTCMLTLDFHANQIAFVWSFAKRLGTNGFKFSPNGSLPVLFCSTVKALPSFLRPRSVGSGLIYFYCLLCSSAFLIHPYESYNYTVLYENFALKLCRGEILKHLT